MNEHRVADTAAAIVCTLQTADDVAQRVQDWEAVLARAVERDAVDGGVRLRFPFDAATAADLGRLAALEVGCCGWLDFSMAVSAGTI
ncbi:MAG: hypothetical protein QOG87_1196, partial [Actinomycetota bacterium]